MNEKVSVIILNYNGAQRLKQCLRSVLNQTYRNYEVIVIDNASTDESVELVKREFPMVRLIVNDRNLGYAEGNNVGIRNTDSEYMAILNYDAEVDERWLSELVKPLTSDETVVFSTSKILYYDDRKKINACGNLGHFTGFAFCRGLGESSDNYCKSEFVSSISGCAFLARRKALNDIGLFDSDFFAYLEDTDLSWRALLMGYKIIYVPTSIAYHKYSGSLTPWKYFHLEKNRYALLIKHFKKSTLISLLPALTLSEVLAWGYAIKSGLNYVTGKVKAYAWVIGNWGKLINKRKIIQARRRTSDRELMSRLTYAIPSIGLPKSLGSNRFPEMLIEVFNSFFKALFLIVMKVAK